jgi:hypothetical protein
MVAERNYERYNLIYGSFKQAMYELAQSRKVSDILGGDIKNILEGKIGDGEKEIRVRFFDFASKFVEEEVNARFREYKHDQETK